MIRELGKLQGMRLEGASLGLEKARVEGGGWVRTQRDPKVRNKIDRARRHVRVHPGLQRVLPYLA